MCKRAALWLPKHLEFWQFLDFSDSATLLILSVYYAEVASGSVRFSSRSDRRGERNECRCLKDFVIVTWQREIFKSALLKMVTLNEMKRGVNSSVKDKWDLLSSGEERFC